MAAANGGGVEAFVTQEEFDSFKGATHAELGRHERLLRAFDGLPETTRALREIVAKLSNQVGGLGSDLRAHKRTLEEHEKSLDKLEGWEESSKVHKIAELQAANEKLLAHQREDGKARINWLMTVIVGVVTAMITAGLMRALGH